jgi:hypothetical protein
MRKVISLTVLPSRLQHTIQTIESLSGQVVKADEICIWLPKKPIRDTKSVDNIPDFLIRKGIRVEFVDDVGSATKLLPALKRYWNEKQTIIVTADDDQIYPPEWFGGLVTYADIYKNACLGYRGKRFLRIGKTILSYSYNMARFYFGHKIEAPIKVDIITGTWGALYRVGFFTEEVFDLDVSSPMLFTDDIWFSGELAKNKIEKYVIPSQSEIVADRQRTISSLYEYNKDGKNNNWSIQQFKNYF